MKKLLAHPLTQKTRTILRRIVITCAVILAVAFVTTLSVDLGPALRDQAERRGSTQIQRPMHIGRLGVRLWNGKFFVEDFVIEGLTPESRPFLTARRIDISMPWSTLFSRRVVFDAIEMTDWDMYVEMYADGRHSFPKFTRDTPRQRSAWTTTLQYVRAHRGSFTYEDHGTPWSTIARNLDVTVARPGSEYRGRASFSQGTIQIQQYEPMRADMETTFLIDGGRIVMERIDLRTDGAVSELTGIIEANRWPEQTYQIKSRYDLPTMRRIFFAKDDFELAGNGEFTGTFHLFKETVNGRQRNGRDLQGTFTIPAMGVDQYRFTNMRGNVRWVPENVVVSNATASLYSGTSSFTYTMEPLNQPGVPPTYTFDARYSDVDLSQFMAASDTPGIRLAGRATGRNTLQWESHNWASQRGGGELQVAPPAGATVMTGRVPLSAIDGSPKGSETGTVPLTADLSYSYGPDDVIVNSGRVGTPGTWVEFSGRTAYGDQSRMPFHVTSSDWQESDRVLAGLMTAFGAPTAPIEVGGYGLFDGTMDGSFRRPRIEGKFTGEKMKAFDVVWGSATGDVVIENSYANVNDVVIRQGDATIITNGRYSLGFPRRDGGEEINSIVRLINWPMVDLKHAFELDDYDVDGLVSGEYHVYDKYLEPFGFGTMAIVNGVAYGEKFETAQAGVRLEGEGVRLDDIVVSKGGGRGTGAAWVGWDGTYSFNFNGQRIPVETLQMVEGPNAPPLSGLVDFNAGGSGTFDVPQYDVRGIVRDFFVADEGIGQVVGNININGETMSMQVEIASPRLAVSGTGQIELNDAMDTEMRFTVSDTSLDPYIRAFQPDLSPYTNAVASGSIRVDGSLADIDNLVVDATVDKLDIRFFDYRIVNAAPIQASLDRHSIRVADMRLVGEDTELNVSGILNLHDERITARATGTANLGIIQGFIPDVRSSGRASVQATLEGPMRDPLVSGAMNLENGRIRHFGLPHALENLSGAIRFDTRGVRFDELRGRLGGGDVQFGGGISIENYRPGRVDMTMSGQNMRLRFPEGMTSLVDADLTLQGTMAGATLGGGVVVRNAVYRGAFDTSNAGAFALGGSLTSTTAPLETTIPLRYDVSISVPSTLRIENRAIQLEATANLDLRGTYDRPVLVGRAEIVRGYASFEGRRYQVTRGSIDFNNPTRIDPFIDIETETRIRVPDQTYRVNVRAVGTMNRLSVEFSSDPPLAEVEVAGLLFGDLAPGQDVEFRQYASVTPQQQLLQERATRALTGTLSAQVGRVVEQTFGVDTFQLTPSLVDPNAQSSRLDPAARLTIGKRLSDRVYLTYSRSLSSSTRDQIILLEYDQTDRFSWILSRNEDRTYALDVRVRHVF